MTRDIALKDRMGLRLLPVLLATCSSQRVVSAVCPWCEKPRRCDRGGWFIGHRSARVKGRLKAGRPRVYVGADECPGSGERPGETKAANET